MPQDPVSSFFNLLWFLFFFFILLTPLWKKSLLAKARLSLIKTLEKKRKSRVIALIHRQEKMGFLGFSFFKFITIEDSESILRAIRSTPPDTPIDFIIHTPGGLALAATQIANALSNHKGPVRVIIPHYAMRGGTLIAMAADEILMDPLAVVGPVDPQLGNMPAASILKVVEEKEKKDLEDQTLILADVAKKAMDQMKAYLYDLLKRKGWEEEKIHQVIKELVEGKYTHDYPITAEKLKELGFPVSTEIPSEVYALMELYEQPFSSQPPSVQYVPHEPIPKKNEV